MEKKKLTKVDIIRSVRDGDRLDMELEGWNVKAFRTRMSELNRKDGYFHYRIAANEVLNILSIFAYPKDGNQKPKDRHRKCRYVGHDTIQK